MKDIMVDIETLGTDVDSVITHVAMLEFDRETGEYGENECLGIDIQSSLNAGLKISADTLLWWFGAKNSNVGDEARQELINRQKESMDIKEAMTKISSILTDRYYIWAKPPMFDMSIIQYSIKICGLSPRWDFRKIRCVRTILDYYPKDVEKAVNNHDPLSDCMNQVDQLVKTLKLLNKS